LPLDGDAYDYFGHSVSISGNYAIVGAPAQYALSSGPGSSYIFERSDSGWSQVAKLTGSDMADVKFGYSV